METSARSIEQWISTLPPAAAAEARERLRRATAVLAEPIHRSRAHRSPLSFAQERLWFLEQLQPGNVAYHLSLDLRLGQALDPSALEWSLNEVVRRHEVLRSRFTAESGRPVQEILPELLIPLPIDDLRGEPLERREAVARERVRAEKDAPFDLRAGPLLRARLLRLDEADWLFLTTLHHLVADGWSLAVLQNELSYFYAGRVAGGTPQLVPLPLQYADYAAWQRERLAGSELERQMEHWRDRLRGAPTVLDLPTDHPRPPIQTFRGGFAPLSVGGSVLANLRGIAQQGGATLFMVLLAAYGVLLGRSSRQLDLLVGTPIAGRLRSELEGLIGLFVNTLVLRIDLGGAPSFRHLLGRVREATLDAFDHQELPFERLVEALQPERRLDHNPLFQVMFVLQNLPTAGSGEVSLANRGNGVPAPLVTEAGLAKFDLTLSLAETAGHPADGLSGGLGGGLEYNADLFSAETAARWAERFVVLLEGIATEPDLAVSELPLLAAAERLAVTRTWVETTGPLPTNTLPEVITARAREHGDVIALEFGAERVSYAELDRRANALALRLRAHGVGPEVLVALGLERSIELVVAILGTWKAGGAYVPLDPASPRERLAYMLADAAPLLLLTQSALRDRWPDSASATFEVLCLDGADSGVPALSAPLPLPALPETTLDHLAYVIYTSGSTGRPKGVGIPHRGIRHVVASTAQRLGFAPGRRVLQFASPSFDASIWEIAQTLASGATLVLAPREDLHPGPPLEALVRERRIDLITLPPSALPYLSPEALPELATVVLGGEVCPASVIAPWLAAGRTVWNAYGPTEISVCATVAACEQPEAVVPIGRPITNLRVFLLDDGGHPVGIGQPGEILIGGAGLARGYLGRPDLSAERFVPDPFATHPGERLYRTGDLGRFRDDGQIEFLGRTDDQIKIRGFRIELGEIEAVLREEPRLAEVAVLAWPEGEQERRLVAYYTLAKTELSASPSAADLRRWAKERLPEVMVPVDWIALDAMPKTVSGKLDRRGLPAPPRVRGDELPSYVAPRTVIEAKLAELWGEVLGLERVGIHDEFFTLGGHSLRMTQVLSRIRETLGVEIPLRTFFAEPTIARLAAAVEEGA